MAQPRDYTRQYNFSDFQTTSPSDPLPAAKVDSELNAVKLTLDDLNTNIALVQRDDGALKNNAVHKDAFDTGALALINATGYTPKGDWATSTSYSVNDLVDFNSATYLATSAHTSAAAFATDLAANKWLLMANAAIATTASAVDKFEGTGSQTAFTLSYTYASNTSVLVFVNGALRNPGDDYSISGTTLTFVTAPSTPSVSGNENVIVWGASVVAQAAKESAASSQTNASGFANEAQSWASKVNGIVESTDYSSKAWSIGGTGVDNGSGSSKDWATKTGGTVGNTSEYSAKYYATNANVGTVATNIANVNTVAGSNTQLGQVAGQISPTNNISTVAGAVSNIGTNATNIANINTCATNISDITGASTQATNAANSATASANSATSAQNYAVETDSLVTGTSDDSAKSWAIGGSGGYDMKSSGKGDAKSWATYTTGTVDGTEKSAKEYAIGSQGRGSAGAGSAKDWASYVDGSNTVDGTLFSAKYYANQAANSAASAGNSLSSFQAVWQGSGTSPPSGGTVSTGDLFFNTTSGNQRLQVYNGSAWVDAALDSSSVASPGFAIAMSTALG